MVTKNEALRTVREILTADWLAAGNTGRPPRAFIRRWRIENIVYGRWSLTTRFRSGSLIPTRPVSSFETDPDDAATEPAEVTERRERNAAAVRAWLEEQTELPARGRVQL